MAAITGLRTLYGMRRGPSWVPAPPDKKPLSPALKSAPAQKAFPAPVRTTARTASSASAAPMAKDNSSLNCGVHAFIASGRFNVMVATPSRTSYITVSKFIRPPADSDYTEP